MSKNKIILITGLSPWRSQLLGLIKTTHATWTNRTRR